MICVGLLGLWSPVSLFCLYRLGADSNSCALVVFATVRVGFIDLALSTASFELLSVLVRAEAADLGLSINLTFP